MSEIAPNQARAVARSAVIAKRESADGYARLVAQIGANPRVVECTAGIQWVRSRRQNCRLEIPSTCGRHLRETAPCQRAFPSCAAVQRRGDKGRAWHGVSFCRTKQALLRCVREWVPGKHPPLEALPDWFPEEIPEF